MRFDRIYYWVGGTERGEWKEAWPADIAEGLESVRRAGYYAVLGRSSIGAPEGNPFERRGTKAAAMMASGRAVVCRSCGDWALPHPSGRCCRCRDEFAAFLEQKAG